MTNRTSGRHGLLWAVVGGVVLLAGVAAIVIATLVSSGPSPTVTSTPVATSSPPATVEPATSDFVDVSASERGWMPEPITQNAADYAAAALAAASTFDATLSSRDEWLDYLDSWFTPDTRYSDPAEQIEAMEASQLELRQGVVLPEADWNSLAGEGGRVVATIVGDVELEPVPEDASGDMQIGTASITLTFTRTDGDGGETSYDESVRVSVQVLCGGASVPTPASDQQAGDCKVIRYFSGIQEP